MSPHNDTNTGSIPVEFAVTLGRIEEKLNGMSNTESKTGERLDRIENRISNVELNMAANVQPKTPWTAKVGAWVGVVTGAGSLVGLFVLLSQISAALTQLP